MRAMVSAVVVAILLVPLGWLSIPAHAQDVQAAEPDPAPGWVLPSRAFDESLHKTFIHNEFLRSTVANSYPTNAVLGFTDEGCPDGWPQLSSDDGDSLFYAFGLLVDSNGNHQSEYVRVSACVKTVTMTLPTKLQICALVVAVVVGIFVAGNLLIQFGARLERLESAAHVQHQVNTITVLTDCPTGSRRVGEALRLDNQARLTLCESIVGIAPPPR